ncbi:hypothetical protein D3C78_1589220 [compost metagenome]
MDTACRGNQPAPGLGQAELGMFGGDDDVAGQGQLQSAAMGRTIEPCNQRLGETEAVGQACGALP